jgi:hypothetical protein
MAAAFPMVLTSFFLPGLWVLCVCLGVGFARIAAWSRPVAAAVLLLLVAHPLLRSRMPEPPAIIARPSIAAAWAAWPETWDPFRPDRSWDRFGRDVFASLPEGAELIVCWEEGTTLRYLQLAESLRPDITLHWTCDNAPRIEQIVREAQGWGRPVYSTIPIARLPEPEKWSMEYSGEHGGLARHAPPPDEPELSAPGR